VTQEVCEPSGHLPAPAPCCISSAPSQISSRNRQYQCHTTRQHVLTGRNANANANRFFSILLHGSTVTIHESSRKNTLDFMPFYLCHYPDRWWWRHWLLRPATSRCLCWKLIIQLRPKCSKWSDIMDRQSRCLGADDRCVLFSCVMLVTNFSTVFSQTSRLINSQPRTVARTVLSPAL
jgi:hypothetical protein